MKRKKGRKIKNLVLDRVGLVKRNRSNSSNIASGLFLSHNLIRAE